MLLIKHGHIKPIERPDFIGDILVDDGKIAAMGESLSAPYAEILDAEGLLVTPGLIDAHTHIGIDEEGMRWEGADYNEMSDPITPDMRAVDGINPMDEGLANAVAAGVTAAMTGPGSANVVGGTFCAIKLAGTDISDMVIKDPAAMKAARNMSPLRISTAFCSDSDSFAFSRLRKSAGLRRISTSPAQNMGMNRIASSSQPFQ